MRDNYKFCKTLEVVDSISRETGSFSQRLSQGIGPTLLICGLTVSSIAHCRGNIPMYISYFYIVGDLENGNMFFRSPAKLYSLSKCCIHEVPSTCTTRLNATCDMREVGCTRRASDARDQVTCKH
jgi:hypothetical protein